MATREVHWHEGMFLRPHHFQASNRHLEAQSHRSDRWDHYYNWGLSLLDLDLEALANHRFVVRSLEARWHDGTAIAVPEDGVLPVLELKPVFEQTTSTTIYLGVPVLRVSRPNVSAEGSRDVRYRLETQPFEDENEGSSTEQIQVRALNARLLLASEDHTGFEVLPIAKVVKSATEEGTLELDETYIPPLLACDSWKSLVVNVLQAVYDRIGTKIELLAHQVVTRGIGFGSNLQADALIFGQLQKLNEAYALLGVQLFLPGLHPLTAYLELCRLVGHLAIFGQARRSPSLPRYDHDDLGGCFFAVKRQIDALLDRLVEPEYKERPFVGAGMRMQVALEPAWLEPVWQMYIGVRSPLETEECIRLLTRSGKLDMKIGSSDQVDTIFRLGQAGLRFTHAPRPPRALPAQAGLIYFQINRDAQEAEWQNVQKSLTLAIRLNENLIAGTIQGKHILRIKAGKEATTLQFTLYVVPQGVL